MSRINKINSESVKHQHIIDTATDLFLKFGVKRVTVEEICRSAKVSKMTFYKYFKNKTELAEYIIFSILDTAQKEFDSIWKEISTFQYKIDQFIKLKMIYAKKFSKEFLGDFMNLSPRIHDKVLDYSRKNQIAFIKLIEQAQSKGVIRKDVSIDIITFMLNHFIELRDDKRFLNLYGNVEDLTSEMLNFFFYGVMGKK
jgi:AcrR family transcriptional regulator